MWGFNDAIEDLAYDPELSKQLLAEAGFPDGLSEVTIAEDIMDAMAMWSSQLATSCPLRLYYMPVDPLLLPDPERSR